MCRQPPTGGLSRWPRPKHLRAWAWTGWSSSTPPAPRSGRSRLAAPARRARRVTTPTVCRCSRPPTAGTSWPGGPSIAGRAPVARRSAGGRVPWWKSSTRRASSPGRGCIRPARTEAPSSRSGRPLTAATSRPAASPTPARTPGRCSSSWTAPATCNGSATSARRAPPRRTSPRSGTRRRRLRGGRKQLHAHRQPRLHPSAGGQVHRHREPDLAARLHHPSTSATHTDAIIQTSDGGYAVAGNWTDPTFNGADPAGALLLKLDASGNLQWQKAYSGGVYCFSNGFSETCANIGATGESVHQTSDGGYVLAGDSNLELTDEAPIEPWLAKVDATGNLVWQHPYYQTYAPTGRPPGEFFTAAAPAP